MRIRAAIVLTALVVCGQAFGAVSAEIPQPRVGQPAPQLSLRSLEGKPVALSDYNGRIVVLHFGAGW